MTEKFGVGFVFHFVLSIGDRLEFERSVRDKYATVELYCDLSVPSFQIERCLPAFASGLDFLSVNGRNERRVVVEQDAGFLRTLNGGGGCERYRGGRGGDHR